MPVDGFGLCKRLLTLLKCTFPPALAVATAAGLIAVVTHYMCFAKYGVELIKCPNPLVNAKDYKQEIFDFVIGGGTAGCVIANRLSKSGKWRVLLLEAGGDPLILNGIPALAPANLYQPYTDHMLMSEPQVDSAKAMPNTQIKLSAGKVLGGSSTTNLMIYQRGNPKDYDNWAAITGDKDWSYEKVLPFFKLSETYLGNFPEKREKFHGKSGMITITKNKLQPMIKYWLSAAKELKLDNSDPNINPQKSTFAPIDSNIKNGKRMGVYEAYLKPALSRKNLVVIKYATVTQVLISGKHVTGVRYKRNKSYIEVMAKKEVIICAGVYNSPAILQRSGIGPKATLKKVGIKTVFDLPVGLNLQDHYGTLVGPFLVHSNEAVNIEKQVTMDTVAKYCSKGEGPLTLNWVSGVGFFSTEKKPDWPNMLTFFLPYHIHTSYPQDIERLFGLKDGTMEKYLKGFIGRDAVSALVFHALPESRGQVEIANKDPEDPPYIFSNFFGDKKGDDMKNLVKGVSFMVEMLTNKTKTFKKLGSTFMQNKFPGCNKISVGTEKYYECYLRQFTVSNHHGCCTCSMGKKNDKNAVLDSKLKVQGIENLRVIDASSFPKIINANTHAAVVMLAEKGAGYIYKDWNDKK